MTYLSKEKNLGGTYTKHEPFEVCHKRRKSIFLLIEDLNNLRGYSQDTFFLASSIADHYLMHLCNRGKRAPNLINLSIASLFIAAKMEQPQCPILENLVTVMKQRHEIEFKRQEIIDLESSILVELNFDIRFVSPHRFFERFQRVFELDQEQNEEISQTVGHIARTFLRYMLLSDKFTEFRPSQQAAASIMHAIRFALKCDDCKLSRI